MVLMVQKGIHKYLLQKYVALLYNWSVVFIVTFTVSVSATTDYVWLQINFQSTTPSMCSHFTLKVVQCAKAGNFQKDNQ